MKQFPFYIILFFLLSACNEGAEKKKELSYQYVEGATQGTSFHITFKASNELNFSSKIDSLLNVIDKSMSVHNPSTLMTFNEVDSSLLVDEHILKVFWKSKEIFELTNGSFDPAVKPLIDFWGFGGSKAKVIETIDSLQIDSMLKFTSIDMVKVFDKKNNVFLEDQSEVNLEEVNGYELAKLDNRLQLDFNAIAQGYTVDLVAQYFDANGVYDYLVEIGGEVRVKGKNAKNGLWTVGIDRPQEENEIGRPLSAILSLDNKSIATSGNYRKFYEKDGVKYSHTLSARTGYPVRHKILSATVVASDAMTADGFATAFMVMGHEKAITFLEENEYLQGYIIYSNDKGEMQSFVTKGLKDSIEERES
jgi:thiamine biosynthesis lipoprotein